MSDATDYATKLEALGHAKRKVESLVTIIKEEAAKLDNWRNIGITNVRESTSHAAPLPTKTINGEMWPTMDDVGKAINDYNKAKKEAVAAYRALPDKVRAVTLEPTL